MDNKRIKKEIEFLFEVGAFRNIDRIWKQFLKPDVANCSEHTFRVAWVALTISQYEKNVNLEKLLKMTLIHDLSESRCGDVHYLSRQYVERKEIEAIADIFKGTGQRAEMNRLIREYEDRKTIEARIVKDADNLDVELELKELSAKGHLLGKIWKKNREKMVYSKLNTKIAQKFWREIHKSNPHSWHLNSPKNRFNSGDWKK